MLYQALQRDLSSLLQRYQHRTIGFSDRAIQVADYGGTYSGQTASFLISYFQDIDGLQAYLELETQRVVCADLLSSWL
jgi:hypothetical protein